MIKRALQHTSAFLLLASSAYADPTFGVGLNSTFGSGQVNTGVGIRVFSDDEEDQAALSLGLDYMFGSESWRTSIGAAYLMDNSYVEVNAGYDFGLGVFNPGIGVGFADTEDPVAPPAAADETDGDTTGDTDLFVTAG